MAGPQLAVGPAGSDQTRKFSPELRATWLRDVSRPNLALLLISYIFLVHLTGLYIFTTGFLLTRLSIPSITPPYTAENPPPIAPTHSKAIILVIDALRTDFISPYPPDPPSPFHHGILSLPAELVASRPSHSLIFNTFSDPPTTTMQRVKGITTGSLPTFVDAGANFASTAIEEDSLISQLVAANKSIAFMGDDTWTNLFPNSFALSHPYDSFNVEDLHSVDNGVIDHLFPYLQPSNTSRWDVLIAHCLGVDHVGHRVGPERDTMKTKLMQMDDVLRRVVDLMDQDTLLVVLGDHGMDSKGNHGGDSEMETAAALWLYSKGQPLKGGLDDIKLVESWPTYRFPGSPQSLRHINQIDIVPTLALLLGIPIPFNNLGSVIPECFANDLDRLETATRVNSEQISRYIRAYGDDAIANSLSDVRQEAKTATEVLDKTIRGLVGADEAGHNAARHHSVVRHRELALEALKHLRALWAQFSLSSMLLGLVILSLSVPMLAGMYFGVRNAGTNWDIYARSALETALMVGAGLGVVFGVGAGLIAKSPATSLRGVLAGSVIGSEAFLILPLLIKPAIPAMGSLPLQRIIGPAIMVIHAVSFASNSFIMWEDRVVLFLLNTIPVVYLIKAMTAPQADMRIRIIALSAAFLAIVRIVGTVTICREEQQPYCRVTFFAGSTPVAPPWILWTIIPLAFQFPRVFGLTLARSKSLSGPAPFFLGTAWRIVLITNATYWVLEWLESYHGLQPARVSLVNLIKLWVARTSGATILLYLPFNWLTSGLCIEVKRDKDQTGESKAVTVYGFANAFGSTYLLFLLIPFALIHLISYPTAQMTLCALQTAIILHIELIDTRRDAVLLSRAFKSSSNPGTFEPSSQQTTILRPSFTDIVPVALIGFLGFFATGHQAVLTSIQWKAAFVGFTKVTYPFSPFLVVLNTWGPFVLSALAVPLLAIWNISPRPQSTVPVLAHALQLSIAFILYHTCVTLASAVCSAWLRRHLMVWKVFAPRFMLAGCTLLVVDISIMVALGVGLRVTSWKVWRTFKCVSM